MAQKPEASSLSIRLPELGTTIDSIKSYRYTEHFTGANDSWTVTIGDESLSTDVLRSLVPGRAVRIEVDGHVQSTGYVKTSDVRTDRSGGVEVTVTGGDRLVPAMRGDIDPNTKFTEDMNVLQFLKAVFTPYGYALDNHFAVDNDENRGILTGQKRGTRKTKRGKEFKKYRLYRLKPQPNERAFQFASRVLNRKGLYIWPNALGDQIVCSTPDFDQEASYSIVRRRAPMIATSAKPKNANMTQNNAIVSSCTRNGDDLPAIVIATGYSAGGDHDHSSIKVAAINEMTGLDAAGEYVQAVKDALKVHADAQLLPPRKTKFPASTRIALPYPVARFLHDEESRTLQNLQNYVARTMALYQQKAFTYCATVEGHTIGGVPIATDTIVNVDDDVCDVHGRLWVSGRTFSKMRGGEGTTTEIECILPYTLELDAFSYGVDTAD